MAFLTKLFKREAEPVEIGPLYGEVRQAMNEVQAYARSHGGNIDLLGVSHEGDVSIRLRGTCDGCPMSDITIKLGIEQRLKVLVPGVRSVQQVS